MELLSKLRLPLEITADERKKTSLLFWHSFVLGIATSFFFVASNSFFIRNVPLSNIPVAYIAAGVCGLFMVSGFKGYQRRHGVFSSYVLVLVLFAIIAVSLYFLHRMAPAGSIYAVMLGYAGFVLIYPFSVLFIIGFSSIGLSLFNISQSKRLTALVGTGEIIASILGYIIVPFITQLTGNTETLFLLSGFVLLASVVPLQRLRRAAGEAANKTRAAVKLNVSALRKDEFYKLVASFTFLSVVAMYLSDYAYLLATRQLAVITEIEVAVIISMLFTLIKAGELIFSFLSGNIITSRGMHFALILLPALLTIIMVCALFSEFIFSDYAFFLIVFFLLNKWNERVIRKGITAPALKVLYQVTKPSERAQIQTLLEGFINQLATIVVGLLLFLLTSFIAHDNPLAFFKAAIYVSIVLLAAWLLVTNKLFQVYKKRVREFLHGMRKPQEQAVDAEPVFDLSEALFSDQVQQIKRRLSANDRAGLLDLLSNYHPSLRGVTPESVTPAKLSRLYFQDDYFFSRWLLVQYLYFLPYAERARLVQGWYDISNMELRMEMVKSLHSGGGATEMAALQPFFQARLEDIVKEIAWAEAARQDSTGEQYADLRLLFESYRDSQRMHLLQVMKLVFDAAAISTIEDIMLEKDREVESSLFVVELLESLLPPEQKALIVPVFEMVPFGRKKARWAEHFYFRDAAPRERLQEYLLRDYKMVLPWNKYHALDIYSAAFDGEELLKAFSANKVPYLAGKATDILQKEQGEEHRQTLLSAMGIRKGLPHIFQEAFMLEGTELHRKGRRPELRHAFKENRYMSSFVQQNMVVNIDLIALAICNNGSIRLK